ncbi:MAG: peptidase S41 [Cyclobacteriaceae bacterium]|nr:peptidase S41 [Cyclobacteriaceae bacterium]
MNKVSKQPGTLAIIGIFALILVFSGSCVREDDDLKAPRQIREINEFIWENMDIYYFWRDKMPRNIRRDHEQDPKRYFEKLIYRDDIWSIITDDRDELENRLQGIEKTMGFSLKLYRLGETTRVFAVVELVYDNSPAQSAGIQRGDLITRINDTEITVNNFFNLFFERETYKATFGNLVDGLLVDNGLSIELNAITMSLNPIYYHTVIESDNSKIGYLVYNQFIESYNDELRSVFAGFRSQGVNELILDLRYNPGGAVISSTLLASLIAPRNVVSGNNIFMRYIWNNVIEDFFKRRPDGEENLLIKFKNEEHNLDLNRVFILTSRNTASSSELIINCLRPYMDVFLIGETTSGKYTGSITITDEENRHTWALQPIVLKSANVNGETDYRMGFAPDILAPDDLTQPLGSLDERLLSLAFQQITNVSPARIAYPAWMDSRSILGSVFHQPYEKRQGMTVEIDLPFNPKEVLEE